MKKEKKVKAYQRRTKSGKMVTVKAHTAKYDAAEEALKEAAKRKGAGGELDALKKTKDSGLCEGFDFTQAEFAEWYEGTGSAADKKVEKALRKSLGKKAYEALSDLAADNYKKGGANSFFSKNVNTPTEKGSSKASSEYGAHPKSAKSKDTSESPSSDNFQVSESTLKKLDREIARAEKNVSAKRWGTPARVKESIKNAKATLSDLQRAKGYLEKGERQKAAKILVAPFRGGFEMKDFYSKDEIKSIKDKAAKKKARKEQAAYNSELEKARSVIAAHEKKQADALKAKQNETRKSLIAQGYRKIQAGNRTYYFKPTKEGMYTGRFVRIKEDGKTMGVPPYIKEDLKAIAARKVGKKYKPKPLR